MIGRPSQLRPREMEALRLYANGITSAQDQADKMAVSIFRAHNIRREVRKLFEVESMAAAVLAARGMGWTL